MLPDLLTIFFRSIESWLLHSSFRFVIFQYIYGEAKQNSVNLSVVIPM